MTYMHKIPLLFILLCNKTVIIVQHGWISKEVDTIFLKLKNSIFQMKCFDCSGTENETVKDAHFIHHLFCDGRKTLKNKYKN